MFQYNNSLVKVYTRTKLLRLFNKLTGYYIYTKFKVARDLNFDTVYV